MQIDEPSNEDKPAPQFCLENNLTPVISSITIERLKRAGEKLKKKLKNKIPKTECLKKTKSKFPILALKYLI